MFLFAQPGTRCDACALQMQWPQVQQTELAPTGMCPGAGLRRTWIHGWFLRDLCVQDSLVIFFTAQEMDVGVASAMGSVTLAQVSSHVEFPCRKTRTT